METRNKKPQEQVFFLSQMTNAKVMLFSRKIGRMTDIVIKENGNFPEVTHILVTRPFGDPSLLIPWAKVKSMSVGEVIINLDLYNERLENYEGQPQKGMVLLKDHIMDKKVLDMEGREVEVVYDIKLIQRSGKLYVTDVDLSSYGLLRRIGLKRLADFIYKLAEKVREQTISWNYIQPLPSHISSFRGDVRLNILKEKVADIHPVDMADILEELEHDQRVAVFNQLDTEHASDTLEELDPHVQRDLIETLRKDEVAKLIDEMTPGQAADTLAVLPWYETNTLLELIETEKAEKIRAILKRQEEKIINYAVSGYIKIPPDTTIGAVQQEFYALAKGKDVIMYLYVLDDTGKLLGIIDFKELIESDPDLSVRDVMVENIISLDPESTLKEASLTFTRYGLRALPIMDETDHLLGVVPYRDVMNLKHSFVE